MYPRIINCRNVYAAVFSPEKNSCTSNKNDVKLFLHEHHKTISTNQNCAWKRHWMAFQIFWVFSTEAAKEVYVEEMPAATANNNGRFVSLGCHVLEDYIHLHNTKNTMSNIQMGFSLLKRCLVAISRKIKHGGKSKATVVLLVSFASVFELVWIKFHRKFLCYM